MTTRTFTTLAAAAALAASGCGGGAGADDSAGGRPDDQAELNFARCMREHGIQMPDPKPGGGQRMELKVGGDMSPQRLRTVTDECRKKTGGGPREPSAQEKEQFRDAALKFARCMRQHGVDMPDPRSEDGGIVIGGPRGSSVDPKSPAFQSAEKACKGLLPRGKGGGPQTHVSGGSAK